MKILIVEDDRILSDTIKQCIEKEYQTEQTYDGYEGYILAKGNIYDLIILDLMLPEMSGYDVLLKLREQKVYTPILILSAKDGLQDKIKGFQYGADDYLVKPFEREELLARMKAMIRRNIGFKQEETIQFKELVLDRKSRMVYIEKEEILLQGKQFDILEYLLSFQNTILTKEQIFDKIWEFNSDTTTNVVEVYASRT